MEKIPKKGYLTLDSKEEDYYVYVYIDPRDYEDFYYGKGKNNRKLAHLSEDSDSQKVEIIKAIRKAGLKPIIKVIARGLTEDQAFLVEETLIWKLGRTLVNKSSGHFADKFRPQKSFHKDLLGFDIKNGIYHVNILEDQKRDYRRWEDCKKFNFIAAGHYEKGGNPLKTLEIGDIVAAYINDHGYVGIGKVKQKAVPIDDFRFKGKSLRGRLKAKNSFENYDNEKSEFLVEVTWLRSVSSIKGAKWKKNAGLKSNRGTKVSLQNQQNTIEFLEKEFHIEFSKLQTPITYQNL